MGSEAPSPSRGSRSTSVARLQPHGTSIKVDRTQVPLPVPLPVLPSLGGRDNAYLWIEGEGRVCRACSRGEMNSLAMLGSQYLRDELGRPPR